LSISLRRTHFNPHKRGRKAKTEAEKRGGKAGGNWPSMDILKEQWMREIEEVVDDTSPPVDFGSNAAADAEEEQQGHCQLSRPTTIECSVDSTYCSVSTPPSFEGNAAADAEEEQQGYCRLSRPVKSECSVDSAYYSVFTPPSFEGCASPESEEKEVAALFERCLECEPTKTITAKEALLHPFIATTSAGEGETEAIWFPPVVDFSWGNFYTIDPSPSTKPSEDAKPLPEHLPELVNIFTGFSSKFQGEDINTSDLSEVLNPFQRKIDLSKPDQLWFYLGEASTEARAEYTHDPSISVHNPKSVFLDSVRPTPGHISSIQQPPYPSSLAWRIGGDLSYTPRSLSARRDKVPHLEDDIGQLPKCRELQTSKKSDDRISASQFSEEELLALRESKALASPNVPTGVNRAALETRRPAHPEAQESRKALDKDAMGIIATQNCVEIDIDPFSDSVNGSTSWTSSRFPEDSIPTSFWTENSPAWLSGEQNITSWSYERVLNTQFGGSNSLSQRVQRDGPVLTQGSTLPTIKQFECGLSTKADEAFLTGDITHSRLDMIRRKGNRKASIVLEGNQLNITSPTKISLFQDSVASTLENEEISLWSDFSDSDLEITDSDSAILEPLKDTFIQQILISFAASKLAHTSQPEVCNEDSASSQPKQSQEQSSKNINSQNSESATNGKVSKRGKGDYVNDEDGGDGDDLRPPKRRKGSAKEQKEERLLACPFCKNDPLRYLSCYGYIIRDISRLK